jgi:hypothetical protein
VKSLRETGPKLNVLKIGLQLIGHGNRNEYDTRRTC